MRGTVRRLTLTLLSSATLLVALHAEAGEILLLANLTCTDAIGTTTICNQRPGILLSTDLISTGNDSFQLEVGAVVGTWDATIMADDGVNFDSVTVPAITDPGTYYVQFAAFSGIDFSSLDSLALEVANASSPGDFITVGRLAAVPEPSTALLFASGLVALAASRRRLR